MVNSYRSTIDGRVSMQGTYNNSSVQRFEGVQIWISVQVNSSYCRLPIGGMHMMVTLPECPCIFTICRNLNDLQRKMMMRGRSHYDQIVKGRRRLLM